MTTRSTAARLDNGGPRPHLGFSPALRFCCHEEALDFVLRKLLGRFGSGRWRSPKSIVGPLLAYHSEHYQALREVHGPLLKSIETITGKRAPFIQPNMTGPQRPKAE